MIQTDPLPGRGVDVQVAGYFGQVLIFLRIGLGADGEITFVDLRFLHRQLLAPVCVNRMSMKAISLSMGEGEVMALILKPTVKTTNRQKSEHAYSHDGD